MFLLSLCFFHFYLFCPLICFTITMFRQHQQFGIHLFQVHTPIYQIPYFCFQYTRSKRFQNIIICTQFKSSDDVFVFHLRCQHDKRNMTSIQSFLHLLAAFKSVLNGHHHITKNQVRLLLDGHIHTFLSIGSHYYVIILPKQNFQIETDIFMIFYNQ